MNVRVTSLILSFAIIIAATSSAIAAVPTNEEIAELLQREPISLETWPQWRGRLKDWLSDKSDAKPAFDAALEFLKTQAPNGSLDGNATLEKDPLAWYLIGSSYVRSYRKDADAAQTLQKMSVAFERSKELDPKFGRARRGTATVHLLRGETARGEAELKEMNMLDPSISASGVRATAALLKDDFSAAERHLQLAMKEVPHESQWAVMYAALVLRNEQRVGSPVTALKPLVEQFPDNGEIACFNALALAMEGDFGQSERELDRSRTLGADPDEVIGAETVAAIKKASRPSIAVLVLLSLIGFIAIYAVLMVLMAVGGLLLGRFTRGTRALAIIGREKSDLVRSGQVQQTGGESWLARLYGVALFVGLICFYIAVPFLIVGVIVLTLAMLYLIFSLGRIPVKLVLLIVIAGIGMIWLILKSLFTSMGRGGFGVSKTAQDCPRLYNVLQEVAGRVETNPVDEVYIAPGSGIGVHQEGRGPFGIFGVNRRVLSLGISTLRTLTLPELKAILAHEYAHFTHRDTFYGRFIHQVSASIEQTLNGMGQAAGKLNYVNPVYWFMYLYYKAYSLLSAGFSRSREFLADRMAATFYGADVFASALRKVAVDGDFFESGAYGTVSNLLAENKAFDNIYDSFAKMRSDASSTPEWQEHEEKTLNEKGSLYSSHPTLRERFEAVALIAKAETSDSTPAINVFENPEAIEKEMTQFLTGYMQHIMMLQAQAAAAPA